LHAADFGGGVLIVTAHRAGLLSIPFLPDLRTTLSPIFIYIQFFSLYFPIFPLFPSLI